MFADKPKLINASAYAAIVTVIFVVVITVWAELSVPLKDWLKNFSGHHWTSKSIFSVLLYGIAAAILYWAPHKHGAERPRRTLGLLLLFTALGTLVIAAFYTGHYFALF